MNNSDLHPKKMVHTKVEISDKNVPLKEVRFDMKKSKVTEEHLHFPTTGNFHFLPAHFLGGGHQNIRMAGGQSMATVDTYIGHLKRCRVY
jgi:hypothetical protein